jgi:hypothetical protein
LRRCHAALTSQRRRSRSAAVIWRSFTYRSVRLGRISENCALIRKRRLPSDFTVDGSLIEAWASLKKFRCWCWAAAPLTI